MLTDAPGVSVVNTTASPRGNLDTCRMSHPDCVVADFPAENGELAEAVRLLGCGATAPSPVLAVSHETDAEMINALLELGVCGVVVGDADATKMVRAVTTVANGSIYLTAVLVGGLIQWLREKTVSVDTSLQVRAQNLTPREREILVALASGKSLDDAAHALFISISTIRTHVYRIRQKLHLRDRTELVSFAFRAGLATPVNSIP